MVNHLFKFGLGEFSWLDFNAYLQITSIKFNTTEIRVMSELAIMYINKKNYYRDDSAPPPYMSKEFSDRRTKALKQVKELS